MKTFNLSEWALRHRTLVTYFMLVVVVVKPCVVWLGSVLMRALFACDVRFSR